MRLGLDWVGYSFVWSYNSRQKLLPIKIVGWALILCHDALARLLAADVANVPCDKVARRQGGKVASSLRAETTQCM